jgi:hypothetical protein
VSVLDRSSTAESGRFGAPSLVGSFFTEVSPWVIQGRRRQSVWFLTCWARFYGHREPLRSWRAASIA